MWQGFAYNFRVGRVTVSCEGQFIRKDRYLLIKERTWSRTLKKGDFREYFLTRKNIVDLSETLGGVLIDIYAIPKKIHPIKVHRVGND